MRKLVYVPMIHEEGDRMVGFQTMFGAIAGEKEADRIEHLTKKSWQLVLDGISRLPENLKGVRLFVEGITSEDVEHIKYLSSFPTEDKEYLRNRLQQDTELTVSRKSVIDFMIRGAKLEATETQNYVDAVETVMKLSSIIEGMSGDLDEPATDEEARGLYAAAKQLEDANLKRDQDVARAINEKLLEGETGILFMGMSHRFEGSLDKDIQVEFINEPLMEIQREMRGLTAGSLTEGIRTNMIELFSVDPEAKG